MADITVSVDARDVLEALDRLDRAEANRRVYAGLKKAGNWMAGRARSQAPDHPRKLKSTIRARKARRDRPGVVVSARHPLNVIVQGGTKDRYTKSGAYRGRIKPNPFITRTANAYEDSALDMAEDAIGDALEL